jgi:hypothetical protein
MDNRHAIQHLPASVQIAGLELRAKTIFDGTKLRLEPTSSKTTTYGRNCYFQPISIRQNRDVS